MYHTADQLSSTNVFNLHSIFVRVLAVLSDYRGLAEVFRMKGSPSFWACFKCWISGFLAGPGKRVYPLHWTQLPLDHQMRAPAYGLTSLHNFGGQPRTGQELPPWDRSTLELKLGVVVPTAGSHGLLPGERPVEHDGKIFFEQTV